MFLKPHRVRKDGKTHVYWSLVESYRTARGPRHRVVGYLGELNGSEKDGWARFGRQLSDKPEPAYPLWESGQSREPVPQTVQVNVRAVRVERTRAFGDVYLGLVLWRMLGLDQLLDRVLPKGRESVPWPVVTAILALARFCEPSSELHIAQTWYRGTGLEDLLGVALEDVDKDRLYRAHDKVLPFKEEIETLLSR